MHESELSLIAYQVAQLTRWFPELINKNINILDFGCGSGLMANFVQNAFPQSSIYAIDSDEQNIQQASELFPKLHCFVMQNDQLPFEDNFFDLIYAAHVFHHIPYTKHTLFCMELLRVLKPSGTLIIFELNPFNIKTRENFKNNPLEHEAHLIPFWHWYKIFDKEIKISYQFLGYSVRLDWLQPIISKLPFGQLYAVKIVKCKSNL